MSERVFEAEMAGFSRSNLVCVKKGFAARSGTSEKVQQAVGLIPWGHHLALVSKVSDPAVRAW